MFTILYFTGYVELDDVIRVLLGTSMFVGGIIGFILDNIVPGKLYVDLQIKWKTKNTTLSERIQDYPSLLNDVVMKVS